MIFHDSSLDRTTSIRARSRSALAPRAVRRIHGRQPIMQLTDLLEEFPRHPVQPGSEGAQRHRPVRDGGAPDERVGPDRDRRVQPGAADPGPPSRRTSAGDVLVAARGVPTVAGRPGPRRSLSALRRDVCRCLPAREVGPSSSRAYWRWPMGSAGRFTYGRSTAQRRWKS